MKRSSDTPEPAVESSPEKKAREGEAPPPVADNSGSIGSLFVEDTEGSAPPEEQQRHEDTVPEDSSSPAPASPEESVEVEQQPLCHFFAKASEIGLAALVACEGFLCVFSRDVPPPIQAVICTYYLHGSCRNGSSCRFSHHLPERAADGPSEAGPPPDVCKFFWHGSCRAGTNCKWRHVKAPSTLSAAPRPVLPMKSDPAVSERAKALLQRHSISRVAHESGATEVVVKDRAIPPQR